MDCENCEFNASGWCSQGECVYTEETLEDVEQAEVLEEIHDLSEDDTIVKGEEPYE